MPAWPFLVLVLGLLGTRRWAQYGEFAPGLDPGNWFAVGRDILGEGGKETSYGYPPLVPILLHLGQKALDPMLVVKLVAVASLVAVVVSSYVLSRGGMAPWFALTTATSVGFASIFTETTAFGGYPQNVALAFLLLSAIAVARYLATGASGPRALVLVALLGAALSHHMYFVLTCLIVAVVWLIWLAGKPSRTVVVRRTTAVVASGLLAVAVFSPTLLRLRNGGYQAPLNASRLDLPEALRMGVREAPVVWMIVLLFGTAYVGLTVRRRREPTRQAAAALLVVSIPLFLVTSEQRLLPVLIVGAAVGSALALHDSWLWARGKALCGLPIALAILLPILLWPASDALAFRQYEYYRIVDRSLLDAVSFIDRHHRDGYVVVRHDRRGWPIGWWFEGLTDARIVVGSDERWLGFPQERERADLADRLFEGRRKGGEAAALAAEAGIDLLVFRKWEWIGWERWLAEPVPAVEVIYDDGEFMILDVAAESSPLRGTADRPYHPRASRE